MSYDDCALYYSWCVFVNPRIYLSFARAWAFRPCARVIVTKCFYKHALLLAIFIHTIKQNPLNFFELECQRRNTPRHLRCRSVVFFTLLIYLTAVYLVGGIPLAKLLPIGTLIPTPILKVCITFKIIIPFRYALLIIIFKRKKMLIIMVITCIFHSIFIIFASQTKTNSYEYI